VLTVPAPDWGRQKPMPGATLDRADPLARGLVLRYLFAEGAGSRAIDSARSNHGTFNGGAAWAGGLFGAAVSLPSATSSYIDCGNDPGLQITGDISIAHWINPTTIPNACRSLSNLEAAGALSGYEFQYTSAGNIFFLVAAGNVTSSVSVGNGTIVAGVWTHTLATLRASDRLATLYINGIARASATLTLTPGTSTQNLNIGRRAATGTHWNGRVDDVRVWNRTLSASEAAQVYAQPFGDVRPSRSRVFIPVAAGDVSRPALFHSHYMSQGWR
jgi:hypothetical protein